MSPSGADGFGLDHLPYGVFSVAGGERRVGVRLRDTVLDLHELTGRRELAAPTLNAFLALGPDVWRQTREQVRALAPDADGIPLAEATLHLPFEVADYVDFYASEHHATTVGRILRPGQEPLAPNWRHLPVGYHGRAGTVVASGTPVVRPAGQRRDPGSEAPAHGPTRQLDLEAELGFVVGVPSPPGVPVPYAAFDEHVFGVVGVNDWSARDIQAWESRPLGPFLGKSFATSIAVWVTPMAALEAAWCALPGQDPRPLDYLGPGQVRGLDVSVEVEVDGEVISRPELRDLYWAPAQLLAQLTANGAALRTGDLFATGTISGPRPDQRGCLLELHGGERFLADGARVVLRYSAPGTAGTPITLGEVSGVVRPHPG